MNNSTINTLNLLQDIIAQDKRFCHFLGYKFILNKNVFPIDSLFSFSSKMIAKMIPCNAGRVLDLGTGSGVQAIIAMKKGAQHVVAIDIDDNAIKNATENIILHKIVSKVAVRKGNLFNCLHKDEKFDLIISNLPFADQQSNHNFSHFLFDAELKLHEKLLATAKNHLNKNGSIFITTGDVGSEDQLKSLISQYTYQIIKIEKAQFNNLTWKVCVLKK